MSGVEDLCPSKRLSRRLCGAIIAGVALFWPVEGWASDMQGDATFIGVRLSDADGFPKSSLAQTAKKISAELKRSCDAWHTYAWTTMSLSIDSQMKQFRETYSDIQDVTDVALSAAINHVRVFRANAKIYGSNAQLTFVWTDNPRAVSICGNRAALEAEPPPITHPPPIIKISYITNNLANPLYQTLEGQMYGATSTLWNWTSVRFYNRRNWVAALQSTESFDIQQFLRYGVTDDLSVSGHIEYDPISSTTTQSGTAEATQKHPGWVSPEFEIYYQVLSQQEGDPLYLNIGPQYSPGWISPNQHFQFQERVGYESEGWAVEFGELTTYNWTTGPTVAHRPDWEMRLGLDGFYELSQRWSVNASVADDILFGQNGRGNYDLQGQVNYYLVPDKLQLSLVYQYRLAGAYANRDNQSGAFAGIQLAYLLDLYEPDR